jgi:hypothetical protein
MLITICVSENAEKRYKVDVVDMKFNKEMKRRLLSLGEEEGRRGLLNSGQNDE